MRIINKRKAAPAASIDIAAVDEEDDVVDYPPAVPRVIDRVKSSMSGAKPLTTMATNNRISIGYKQHPHAAAAATATAVTQPYYYQHKHDPDMISNEFSTGHRAPEIVVIILILCLWVLSLRKLIKHFDKLRSTQYREIPYKYQLKDPSNIASVKIVNNSNEAVLYTRDPVKSLRSKSLACDSTATSATTNNNKSVCGSACSPLKSKMNELKKKSVVDSMLFGSSTSGVDNDNQLQAPPTMSIFNYKKNLSSSLSSMSSYGVHRQCRNHSMGHVANLQDVPENELATRGSLVCYTSNDSTDKQQQQQQLDPAFLLPVVVRRSLLDLHRKSVENLAAAAAACVPDTVARHGNVTGTGTSGTSGATLTLATLTMPSSKSSKSKKFNLASILRPPKLNMQRKSSHVMTDSNQSVATAIAKVSESPV